ncbi:MAG: ion transporter [Synechococcus sp.]
MSSQEVQPYQFFMLSLCVYAISILCVEVFFPVPEGAKTILTYADNFICGFFLLDFLSSVIRSRNKIKYLLGWGWIDLVSSIPTVGFLRIGRLARIVRILRLLRAVRSAKVLSDFALKRRAESTFLASSLIAMLLLMISSIAILEFESGATTNITTPEDAIWWAFVTMTTVGYGDHYPVTIGGRLVAAILMASGIGLFGTYTGFVSSWFLEGKEQSKN